MKRILWGALVLLLAIVLGLWWQWPSGLSVQGWHGWQAGAVEYRQGHCQLLKLRQVRLTRLFPPVISAQQAQFTPCGTATNGAVARLPAFSLSLAALSLADLPPLALTLQSDGKVLRVSASNDLGQLQGQWQPATGALRLQGQGHLPLTAASHWQLTGQGSWHDGQLQLAAKGQLAAGQISGPVSLQLAAKGQHWQLKAHTPSSWPLKGLGSAEGQLTAAGQGKQLSNATLKVPLATTLGPMQLTATTQVLNELSWQLSGSGVSANGTLAASGLQVATAHYQQADYGVSLHRPLMLPWQATTPLPVQLAGHYQRINASITGQLHWPALLFSGQAQLRGQLSDYQVRGAVPLTATPEHIQLAPFAVTVTGPWGQGQLQSNKAQQIRLAAPSLALALHWRYRQQQLNGDISLTRTDNGWLGGVHARTAPLQANGPVLTLTGAFAADPHPRLLAGSHLTVSRGLLEHYLLLPMQLTLRDSLTLAPLRGSLVVSGQGLAATQLRLPAWQGQLTVAGQQGHWQLQVPGWQAQVQGDFDMQQGLTGHWQGELALTPALSGLLPVTFDGGLLQSQGQWQWPAKVHGQLTLKDGRGLLGANAFSGALGQLQFSGPAPWQGTGHVQLATLATGIKLTQLASQLHWHQQTLTLTELTAKLLGGHLQAARLDWPGHQLQPVELSGLSLAQLGALQNKPVVALSGQLSGQVPIQLGRRSLRIENARLHNVSPVALKVLDTDAVKRLKSGSTSVKVALDALGDLAVDQLTAVLDMAADGQATLTVHLRGHNPEQGDLPVNLNYAHQENLLQLLRSLRMGDTLSQQLQQQVQQGETP